MPDALAMKSWFMTDTLTAIGHCKVADMCQPECRIIPGFTAYWNNFAPFVLDLIQLCFLLGYNSTLPNKLTHRGMLSILDKAYAAVKESSTNIPVSMEKELVKNLKRNKSSDPLVPTKRIKQKLARVQS